MKPTVLILAGGRGTRLAGVIGELPKPLAPVAGKPFLEWQIAWLAAQGFERIILLVGYRHEVLREHFKDGSEFGVRISYSVESQPLGTGGAILAALERDPCDEFLILNGDSYFDLDLNWFVDYLRSRLPPQGLGLALKYREETSRYGSVRLGQDYLIRGFVEKSPEPRDGYINGGIYFGRKDSFLDFRKSGPVSLEAEIFPELVGQARLVGIPFGGRFIDIGVPEDYAFADQNLARWLKSEKQPALFLDRDGILIEDTGYLRDPEKIVFREDIIEVLVELFKGRPTPLVIVTNQAGVAKGLMSLEDVEAVNRRVVEHLEGKGLGIAGIWHAPHHPEGSLPEWTRESLLRKPDPGMLLLAADKLGLDLGRSLMVGDKESDRIRLPYLETHLVAGRYPVENGDPSAEGLRRAIVNKGLA